MAKVLYCTTRIDERVRPLVQFVAELLTQAKIARCSGSEFYSLLYTNRIITVDQDNFALFSSFQVRSLVFHFLQVRRVET